MSTPEGYVYIVGFPELETGIMKVCRTYFSPQKAVDNRFNGHAIYFALEVYTGLVEVKRQLKEFLQEEFKFEKLTPKYGYDYFDGNVMLLSKLVDFRAEFDVKLKIISSPIVPQEFALELEQRNIIALTNVMDLLGSLLIWVVVNIFPSTKVILKDLLTEEQRRIGLPMFLTLTLRHLDG